MYRIYDDQTLQRQLRLKQLQVAAVFAAGIGCGLWYANADTGSALAAQLAEPMVASNAAASWCQQPAANPLLRMDCELGSLSR
jgi:hypothetical protein